MSSRTKALLALLAASLLWATAGVAKPLVRRFDPFTVAFLRFLVASLCLAPFFLREQTKKRVSILPLVPLSLAGTANIALFYSGLASSTANAAAIIYSATPLLVGSLAPRLIKEHVSRTRFLGIGIGLVGAVFIAVLPAFERGEAITGDIGGNVFFAAAAISWAAYTIFSRQFIANRGYSPLAISASSVFTSTALFGVVSMFSWQTHYRSLLYEPGTIALIVHLGFAVTVATYLLFQWGIKHSSATTASLNHYLGPVFAVIFNIFFLGERLTAGFILGSIVVLAGVGIATGGPLIGELKRWKMLRGA